MLDNIQNLDTQLFLYLNSFHNSFFDAVMWQISSKTFWIPFYLMLIFFVLRKYKWYGILALVAVGILITLSDQISVQGFKNVFERLRPCHNPQIADIVHTVNNKCGGKYGFVSSHAANTFALAVFLSLVFRRFWAGCLLIFWAALVSYSRIYLGVHYPGDILGGAILGAFIAVLIYWLFRFSYKNIRKNIHKKKNNKFT